MAKFLRDYGSGRYTITIHFKNGKTSTYRGKHSDEAERMRGILKARKAKGDITSFSIRREK